MIKDKPFLFDQKPSVCPPGVALHTFKKSALELLPLTVPVRFLLATCVQHEIDHLNGVVFIDHVSRLKRDVIMRKVKKLKKLGGA